jgi:hypothetical protein
MTHNFKNSALAEMAVNAAISKASSKDFSSRFLSLFHSFKNHYQKATYKLTQTIGMACPLHNYFITTQTVIV